MAMRKSLASCPARCAVRPSLQQILAGRQGFVMLQNCASQFCLMLGLSLSPAVTFHCCLHLPHTLDGSLLANLLEFHCSIPTWCMTAFQTCRLIPLRYVHWTFSCPCLVWLVVRISETSAVAVKPLPSPCCLFLVPADSASFMSMLLATFWCLPL